ncbi:MAG: TonB family protein [Sinobacteraceae bacterium]|nr:TonB family protein [Nevskiaceae bacterium]MBV9914807.1 TonB family protein [Nevskiaceae bacterium]
MALGLVALAAARVPTLQPAELRALRADLPGVTVYPAQARSEHLEGRILLAFRLSRGGAPVGPRIVKADAAELLQQQALELLRSTTYELEAHSVDPATVFHATVIYCMDHCGDFGEYPESNSLFKFTSIPLPGH